LTDSSTNPAGRPPTTVRTTAWLLAGYGALGIGYLLVDILRQRGLEGVARLGWSLAVYVMWPAALLLLAWPLMRRLRWAWWWAVLVAGYLFQANTRGLWSLALDLLGGARPEGWHARLAMAVTRVALLAAALTLLVGPRTRPAFANVPGPAGATGPGSRWPDIGQLPMAVALAVACLPLTAAGKHTEMTFGWVVATSPVAAIVFVGVVVALIFAARRTDPVTFAACCSIVGVPLLLWFLVLASQGEYMRYTVDSAIPFTAVLAVIILRARVAAPRTDGDARLA
jgi:hypothetical protein